MKSDSRSRMQQIYDFCVGVIVNFFYAMIKPWKSYTEFSWREPDAFSVIASLVMGAFAITGLVKTEFNWDRLILRSSFYSIPIKTSFVN